MASSDISKLLRSIQDKGDQFDSSNQASKHALLVNARALVDALESPVESVLRLLNHQPAILTSIIIGVNSGLFHAVVADGNTPKSTKALAEKIGGEPSFIGRIARHLAVENLVLQTGTDEYTPSPASFVLASPEMEGMVRSMTEMYGRCLAVVGPFFRENGYKAPYPRSPLQWALNTDESIFQWALRPENEEMAKAYRSALAVKDKSPKWHGGVPVTQLLDNPSDPNSVLLVDVGGNIGNDLLSFHNAYPDLPGRLILQDLPASIARINKDELKPIEPTGHDFFTPQPVVGAKVYFFKAILHDWNDEKCREILQNTKSALKPGYSKILINDIVVPDRGAGWWETSQDIMMMLGHGAQERSESAWKELVESSGLKITKTWSVAGARESLIEVELA